MIRTAIPFGYLFIALFFAGVFFTGLMALVLGVWRRKRWLIAGGLSVMTVIVLAVIAEVSFESKMEWNPVIRDEALVVGTWADERETITLHADHRVDYHSSNEGFSGKWSLDDWNLRLTSDGVDCMMRFIEYDGQLYLMTNEPDDPDMWDGNLGLERRP